MLNTKPELQLEHLWAPILGHVGGTAATPFVQVQVLA
jgi:hypothetical protein